ncbi:Ig-like domain-containing protein [Brevibacillus gelatini]|uniref:Ig-like domain-containing protein n=1 Tax=Brevibacillus gelatini TaxID=1655277 RepID=A0A3M8B7X0_9BACL|nr:Ig-like domain-containing protein [Brevibacillus gelatini]RNB59536.1 Ig-like domain-containing protein [Brevibacillus gelatini]
MNISDINRYRRFVENGEYQNGAIQRLADIYSQQNSSALSSIDIIINSNRANVITKDGIEYKCVIDFGKLPSKTNLTSYQMKNYRVVWTRRVDGFKTGDIVEYIDAALCRKSYLFLNTAPTRDNYDMSIMQEADGFLKWIDLEGIVRTTPFTLKSSYGLGLQEDKIMILSKERRVIFIQANDDTKQIKNEQRFIFDGRAWEVIAWNGLKDGLIELTLEETQFNDAKDNRELQIADYYGNVAQYTVSILNGTSVSISDKDTLQLNVAVRNNGSHIDNPILTFVSSDENVLTVDKNGLVIPAQVGFANITVLYKNVSSTIHVNVTPSLVNNYTAEFIGATEIKINQSATYNVKFYNNGISIPDKAIFSLVADDGLSATNLASITSSNDTSCTVKANSTIGYIRLKVMNQNGLIKNEMRIKIRSLI